MTPSNFLTSKALWLVTLALSTSANPISTTNSQCDVVKCTATTTCAVIDGVAKCVAISGEKCGKNTCALSEVCCDPFCGICTPPGSGCGGGCEQPPVTCGSVTCNTGEVCCDPFCGICTPPGSGCGGGCEQPPPGGGSGAALYGQCGGTGWTGPTTCASGTCKASNEWYSQCLP